MMSRYSAAFLAATLAISTPISASGAGYARPGRTVQVDLVQGGEQRSADAGFASIDARGRFVAFDSLGSFVSNDVNRLTDVYVRDLLRRTTTLVSSSGQGLGAVGTTGSTGVPGGSPVRLSWDPSISADGRFIAFTSSATNLVVGDTNGANDVFLFDTKLGDMTRISAGPAGIESLPRTRCGLTSPHSWAPSISANGRYVAFLSFARDPNEVTAPSDPLGANSDCLADVYVYDRVTDRTRALPVAGKRQDPLCRPQDNCNPFWTQRVNAVAISGNGRIVAFDSEAGNLVQDDTNAMRDVFVHDTRTGTTERVSVSSQGDQTPPGQWAPTPGIYSALSALPVNAAGRSLSRNGRFVLFYSNAHGLVPADAPAGPTSIHGDYFVHDRDTRRTERVSVDASGRQMMLGQSWRTSSISDDGRYVAMSLVNRGFPDDYADTSLAAFDHVYVHDRRTGSLDMASQTNGGEEALDCRGSSGSQDADWSDNRDPDTWTGRFVTFISCARNIQRDPDPSASFHIFVRDRGTELRSGLGGSEWFPERGSLRPGAEGIVQVADRLGDVLGSGEAFSGADLHRLRLAVRPQHEDLYVALDVASLNPTLPILFGARLTVGGRVFEIRATSSSSPGSNGGFALFKCGVRDCVERGQLTGGIGTTGDSVTVSVPLEKLGPSSGAQKIEEILGFTAFGTTGTGAHRTLDVIRIP